MGKPSLAGKLVVAISSRALFDLTESHRIYTVEGVDAYHRYQVLHEDEVLAWRWKSVLDMKSQFAEQHGVQVRLRKVLG